MWEMIVLQAAVRAAAISGLNTLPRLNINSGGLRFREHRHGQKGQVYLCITNVCNMPSIKFIDSKTGTDKFKIYRLEVNGLLYEKSTALDGLNEEKSVSLDDPS